MLSDDAQPPPHPPTEDLLTSRNAKVKSGNNKIVHDLIILDNWLRVIGNHDTLQIAKKPPHPFFFCLEVDEFVISLPVQNVTPVISTIMYRHS